MVHVNFNKMFNNIIHVTCFLIQKILGQKIQPQLKFFGQAIDGGIDLRDDGLPDIVIGSQGAAVVLRYLSLLFVICSKPRFHINTIFSNKTVGQHYLSVLC